MVIIFIVLAIIIVLQMVYILYYKRQIKDIAEQLAFISKHHSFKFIRTQIRPREIFQLVQTCNSLLTGQRELHQQFNTRNEEINATIVSLSHDIRTPLTSLDGYLQLADRAESEQEQKHYLHLAQSRARRIKLLVDELFLYTKLENQEFALDLEMLDVIELLKRRLFLYINEFDEKGVEPEILLPDIPVLIVGNVQAMERVVENILRNYFLHGKGPLTIQYEANNGEVFIQFANTIKEGVTIHPDYIFNRFYKEDASRTNHSSGLGLAIVQSLMEKMQGGATAEIEQDRFILRLVFLRQERGKEHAHTGY